MLAWRLSQGPLDIPWLAAQMQARLDREAAPTRVIIRSAALAWEGFEKGLGSPVDIRLRGVSVQAPDPDQGSVEIPEARVTLALRPLLAGQVEPRSVELDRPEIAVRRMGDGRLSMLMGGPAQRTRAEAEPAAEAVLAQLGNPPGQASGAMTPLRELSALRVRQAELTLEDEPSGAVWRVPDADFDLVRAAQGGVEARTNLTVSAGTDMIPVSATASISPGEQGAEASFRIAGLRPAALTELLPSVAALRDMHLVLSGEGQVSVGPHLAVKSFTLGVQGGPGTAAVNGTILPITSAVLRVQGTPADIRLDQLGVTLAPAGFSPPVTLTATGTMHRGAEQVDATVTLDVDRVEFAALPSLWPAGLSNDTRRWVLENITNGVARNGHFVFDITADPKLDDLRLAQASGGINGENLTVYWLRPVPPAVDAQGTLRLLGPDVLEIGIASARQAPAAAGGPTLAVTGGTVRINGLEQHDQTADVKLNLSGPVPALLGLLGDPRLNLLSRGKVQLRNAAGAMTGSVSASVPLIAWLTMDQVPISAKAHVTDLRLEDVLAGQTLSQGVFDVSAGADGMTLEGAGSLNGAAARINAQVDFRAGPPTQVLRTYKIAGTTDAAQLASAGLDTQGVLAGSVPLSATVTEQRNGSSRVAVRADLGPAALNIAPLDWRKPAGSPANATFNMVLDQDRLQRIDAIHIAGQDLVFDGNASFTGAKLAGVRAERLTLGRTQLQASVQFPDGSGPIKATMSGPVLDLSGYFSRTGRNSSVRKHAEQARGPAWQADARFDTVILAHGETLTRVAGHADNDGAGFRDLRLDGFGGRGQPLLAMIAAGTTGRTLRVTSGDAGALLRALDIADTVEGGKLTVSGQYQDGAAGRPLSGDLEMTDFRIRNAAGFGKLLQAVTLYGLVDALKGPGVAFDRLMAPFRFQDGVLTVSEARAYSASLGLTAQGTMDLDGGLVNMRGTIVPAYFFNSLLGRMPVIGGLFSAERGGGLIAASFAVNGRLDDPAVTVNPLTALTPGFVRGIFGGRSGPSSGALQVPTYPTQR